MKSKRILMVLAACSALSVLAWGSVAVAQEGTTKSVQFAAPATEAVDAQDPKSLLAACDARVDICERDAVGVPFLAGAYMAIWAILMAFLVVNHRGQRRLELELEELERRLNAADGAAS